MSILDQVINATQTQPVPVAFPAPVAGVPVFRGYGQSIDGYTSDEELLNKTGLNWKVCERPVFVEGIKENRRFEGRKALVRCDNGDMIDIVNEGFKVHQNSEIVAGFGEIVKAIDGRVTAGGYFPGTGRVFLKVKGKNQFDITKGVQDGSHSFKQGDIARDGSKVGDLIDLEFVITGGHKPGTPRKIKACGTRRICTNMATVSMCLGLLNRITHKSRITAEVMKELEKVMMGIVTQFEGYGDTLKSLAELPASPALQQAYLMELTAPNLLGRIINQQMLTGAEIIGEIMDRDEQYSRHDPQWFTRLVNREAARRGDDIEVPRIYGQINQVRDEQPGVQYTRGTLANAYHATTYFVDHLRGRKGGSAAVESALDGDGDTLKTRALDVAVEFAGNVRTVRMGRG